MLRHASVCRPEEDGTCPSKFPKCAQFKELWAHIAQCRSNHCEHQHCISSRCCISHYSRCKADECKVCGPVNETIRSKVKPYKQQLKELSTIVALHNEKYPDAVPPPYPDFGPPAPHALNALAAAAAAAAAEAQGPNMVPVGPH